MRLFDVMKPIDTSTFERLLRTAFEEHAERGQFVILSFGAQSRLELSEQARHQGLTFHEFHHQV